MASIHDTVKHVLLGRPIVTEQAGHSLLPKFIALPVFASDALSSVAYAPDEILATLSLSGLSAMAFSPWVALAVGLVMLTVVASYRQNVFVYTSGGGNYEVASDNLSRNAGLGVASALMADYMLTVAVSIASGTQYLVAIDGKLNPYAVVISIAIVAFIATVNLRGVRESGKIFAIPVYGFIFGVAATVIYGFSRAWFGHLPMASSHAYHLISAPGYTTGIVGLGGMFLLLRSFSSGSAAMTGIEAVSNGVPVFRKPKSKNAATTLLMLGLIAVAMLLGILFLARTTGVNYAQECSQLIQVNGHPLPNNCVQNPSLAQIAQSVFSNFKPMVYFLSGVTAIILFLAANTAFNGFPVLASVLARDEYLPKQLRRRGDRLAFSNGILILALAAIILIIVFDADVNRLIQLYIVGVFISFTTCQFSMIRHWNKQLAVEKDPKLRARMKRSRFINAFGCATTAIVLIIVLATKFIHGAWVTLGVMAIIYVVMHRIHRHYARVREELRVKVDPVKARALPPRVHAIVLVSSLNLPAMRAISYARATRPSSLEVVTVGVDEKEVASIRSEWERLGVPLPVKVLASPYREITRPIVEYVRSVRRSSPRDLVVVFLPEYVVGHWWEQALHNQSAFRIKQRLQLVRGVVVASVPWQLDSAQELVAQEKAQNAGMAQAQAAGEQVSQSGYTRQIKP